MRLTKKKLEQIIKDPITYFNINSDELEIFLRKCSDSYYNSGIILIDDNTFDILKEELEKKDPLNKFLTEIGIPIRGTKNKIELPFPMGSLNKIKHDDGNLEKWLNNYNGTYVLSDKLDGVSAQIYKQNKIIYMYSRGDEGLYGQDLTHLLTIINISKQALVDMPDSMSIRGELIITKDDFKTISNKKNARNTVAG